jgi:predicted GNAT superfamily acetyltransferase
MLYSDLFARLPALGHSIVVCEVNVDPPNPVSDRFHASQRFTEVGRATIDNGAKTVRYLLSTRQWADAPIFEDIDPKR